MGGSHQGDGYDLFVSYARRDDAGGWLSGLVEILRQELGADRVFFDVDTVATMDDWRRRIETAAKSAKTMLAAVSPAYFDSRWCRMECDAYLENERRLSVPGEGLAPVYLRTAEPMQRALGGDTSDPWAADLAGRQMLDVRAGAGPRALDELTGPIGQLVAQIRERIERVDSSLASPSTIPWHNPNFVGREEEKRKVAQMLADAGRGAITAVRGIGGIGKTALALQHAHEMAAEYPGGRFLLETSGVDDLRVAVVKLASHLNVTLTDGEQRDLAAGFARVRRKLQSGPRSLLLLDNVDDANLLAPQQLDNHLPRGPNVHVLVTTRLGPEHLHGLTYLSLEWLDEPDALDLLARHREIPDGQREAAAGIVRRLGGWTLAVEVVAVYLRENPEISHADYLRRLEHEGIRAVEGAGRDELVRIRHPKKLLGPLLKPTFAVLSPAETRVLQLAALLPPDTIAEPWLRALVREEFPEAVE